MGLIDNMKMKFFYKREFYSVFEELQAKGKSIDEISSFLKMDKDLILFLSKAKNKKSFDAILNIVNYRMKFGMKDVNTNIKPSPASMDKLQSNANKLFKDLNDCIVKAKKGASLEEVSSMLPHTAKITPKLIIEFKDSINTFDYPQELYRFFYFRSEAYRCHIKSVDRALDILTKYVPESFAPAVRECQGLKKEFILKLEENYEKTLLLK